MSSLQEPNSSKSPYFECEGWWEQAVYGRQMMDPLQMRFDSGTIDGSGTDIIGPFTFAGHMEDQGEVAMTKQYLGRHRVTYVGQYDGEGLLAGTWRIDDLSGRWMIRLRRLVSDTMREIEVFAPY